MTIGEKLKKIRNAKDLSLDDMAKATGVAKATLSRIENNLVGGNMATLKKIAGVLHVSLDELNSDQGSIKLEKEHPELLLLTLKKDIKDMAQKLQCICKRLDIEIEK